MSSFNKIGKLVWSLVQISVLLGLIFTIFPAKNNDLPIVKDWSELSVIQDLTKHEIVDYFHWSNSSSCRLTNHFGGVMTFFSIDGQKAVCLDTEVRPIKNKCLVYSFGVNNEWSFEDTMDEYGCDVFAFDPSMNQSDHDRGDNVHFFRYGLGNEKIVSDMEGQQGWRLWPLSDFYKVMEQRHGHDRIIDYLKIDIENDEWIALPQILQSGMMDRVRQLGVEIHLPTNGSINEFYRLIGILRSLENYGMVRFDSKLNPFSEQWMEPLQLHSYAAYELAWYNSRLRRNRTTYYGY